MKSRYKEDWHSLRAHKTPYWMQNGKFGIYTHWGAYCVPGVGPNVSWYPHNMYRPGTAQYEAHRAKYGSNQKVGYKDLIERFDGRHFEPDAWAELFVRAGARFAGPVAEHHDGFPMWNTKFGTWNAVNHGPKRDVVGELATAIRGRNMKFMVAMHHAENWWFYPHWIDGIDVNDPAYVDLYGEPHDLGIVHIAEEWYADNDHARQQEWTRQSAPSEAFLKRWEARLIEVVDNYQPDYFFFDFGLGGIPESYKRRFLAYYYNKESEWKKELLVSYKANNLPPGVALVDFELGGMSEQTYFDWITDTTIDTGFGWGYMEEENFKGPRELIHCLADNVSKNGYLLLNVGPRGDGSIPDGAAETLMAIGRWLDVNGEAIYDTVPWHIAGEGPTRVKGGHFSHMEEKTFFTREDIRFTSKANTVYAIILGEPLKNFTIRSISEKRGAAEVFGFETFTGIFPEKIQNVEMLGLGEPLTWCNTDAGLNINWSGQLPCEHAVAIRITMSD